MSLLNALRDILRAPPVKLRCKPGQIARITQRGPNHNRRVHIDHRHPDRPSMWVCTPLQPMWCFSVCSEFPPGRSGNCQDIHLQPIDDGEQADETLRWVPKRMPTEDVGVKMPNQSVWPA